LKLIDSSLPSSDVFPWPCPLSSRFLSLSAAIDSTSTLLNDFTAYNNNEWELTYPQSSLSTSSPHAPRTSSQLRRAQSVAVDEPTSLPSTPIANRSRMQRSSTLANVSAQYSAPNSPSPASSISHTTLTETTSPAGFQVLKLDLALGSNRSSSSSRSLVMSLEKSSVATLLTGKIASELKHLDALRDRIQDTSSKVLVTGDLNAGKSTLVNALMRREVMPMDEQPCTTTFCEVHDARENAGVEEVHMDKEGKKYDQNDGSTFERLPLSSLETLVVEEDGDHKPPLKVFVSDTRSAQESLIHNGVVDISLIDAPGLNRDSLKTTAVFARQDEIDVVVFVVSAANHFTLSAKEFIWTASNEKAYLFIVVNRFDQIKDKERCKRLVLEQIRQLSPRTYEEAEELVHFVDSAAIMEVRPFSLTPLGRCFLLC
jgi:mitofusin